MAHRATRAALKALDNAVKDSWDRKRFEVDKFGRHRDGYLHALVVVDGEQRYYFTRRHGSWLAPGNFEGRERLKEPEALLGSELGRSVKYKLAEIAQKFHPTIKPEPEEADDDGPGSSDETVPTAGVPEAGDRDDAPGGVPTVA